MMKPIVCFFKHLFVGFAPLLSMSVSCSDHSVMSILNEVDSYIQEKPDSALRVLETLNKKDLNSKKAKAKFSLLYSIALDKNYIDTTNLAIIQPAFDFYTKYGSPDEKMKAYFYRGIIYANREEDDIAIHHYFLSLEDSAKVSDNRYKELVNSAISVVFSKNHNTEQELSYAKDALRYAVSAGDSIGIWAITGHLASCHANIRNWDEAMRTYTKYFAMPIYDSTSYVRRNIRFAKDIIRSPNPKPHESINILETISRTHPESMTEEAYCVYAYAHQLLGNSTVANHVITQIERSAKRQEIVKTWRYRIYKAQGKYKEALEDLEKSVIAQDSIVFSALTQSLIQSQRDYLQAEKNALKKENKLVRQRNAAIALFSVMSLCILLLLYLRKKRASDKKITELSALQRESQQMLELQNVQRIYADTQLAEKDAALLELRKQFARMYKAQYKTLNRLCAAYFSPIKKERKEIIYDEVLNQMDAIVNYTEKQDKFMSAVNDSLDNIIDKLREDLSGHKEQDFRFMAYVIAGFDATTISCLTGYSVGTVYTKKHRLKIEISNLTSQHRKLYLEFID